MKALTIQQPYANQIIYTGKDIEIRKWKTDLREWITIHASLQVSTHFQTDTMKRYFYIPSDFADSVVVGAIIGIVEIVDCVETHPSAHFRKIEDAKKTYGFVLANPIPLPFPIQIKGQQKFWNVPTEVEKQIRKQLKGKWDGTA